MRRTITSGLTPKCLSGPALRKWPTLVSSAAHGFSFALNELEGLMREVSERDFTNAAKHAGTASQSAAIKLRGSPGSAHFIGIAGAGMRALASIFLDQGWIVSGSD